MTAKLLYLDAPDLYEARATVTAVERDAEGGVTVFLDETIFYPQGGGQPTDRGSIVAPAAEFKVTKAVFADGKVHHQGTFAEGGLSADDEVRLRIDRGLRDHHSRLHTGGHLVMTAVDRLLGLPATKGYHFPDGPYVEFEGIVPTERREGFVKEVQEELDRLVAEDSEVTWYFDDVEGLRRAGVYIPAEIPSGKPTRVVVTSGYRSPCGGTHVRHLGMLSGLTAKSIKVKSGKTRVSYRID
jgi:Ser-tRNA(Ala) deacylase AlaX